LFYYAEAGAAKAKTSKSARLKAIGFLEYSVRQRFSRTYSSSTSRGLVLSASFRGPLLKFRKAVRDWSAFSQSFANVNSRFTTSPEFSLTGQLREHPVSTRPLNQVWLLLSREGYRGISGIVCESQANRFEKSLSDLKGTDAYIIKVEFAGYFGKSAVI